MAGRLTPWHLTETSSGFEPSPCALEGTWIEDLFIYFFYKGSCMIP